MRKNHKATTEVPDLTIKQRKFCLAFVGVASGNGTEAARIAGYKGNDVTLGAVAYENLNKPQIASFVEQLRAEAEQKLKAKVLTATETLAGLTKIALADIADVFEPDGTFDLQKAKERNVSRLIKSISFDKDTGRMTKLEMHNAHGAHVDLGKYHQLFPSQVKVTLNPEEADKLTDEAAKRHGLPIPETFGGLPVHDE